MKKIGVYLNVEPYGGGTFQYNQSILDALASLSPSEYKIIALYHSELWEKYLAKYNFEQKCIPHYRWRNIVGRVFFRLARYLHMDIARYRNFFSKINILSRQIDLLKLDVIICPSQDILPALVTTNALATIHDLMHRYEDFPEVRAEGIYEDREYLYRNMCLAAEGILVDSEIGKKHVSQCYNVKEAALHVLPFTSPQYLKQCANENETGKFRECLPSKYIFYPAQFWLHKNHKNLLLAMKKLKDHGINVNLVLVGSKKNGYEAVMAMVNQFNLKENVKILGYISDNKMSLLYKNARAMVMPTFFGPTNIPPLEGFVMGCPVAASHIYGMPEQIGDAGLTFNPHDVDEIAQTLDLLWNDDNLCLRLIERGYKRAELFSQECFNKKLKNILDNMINV